MEYFFLFQEKFGKIRVFAERSFRIDLNPLWIAHTLLFPQKICLIRRFMGFLTELCCFVLAVVQKKSGLKEKVLSFIKKPRTVQ